jgi:hypothetical protein
MSVESVGAMGRERQSKNYRASENEPERPGSLVSVLERVERAKIQNARAQADGDRCDDVNLQIAQPVQSKEAEFQRDNARKRDQGLRA